MIELEIGMEINSLSSTKWGNEVLRDVCVALLTLISGCCNSWFVRLFPALDRDLWDRICVSPIMGSQGLSDAGAEKLLRNCLLKSAEG